MSKPSLTTVEPPQIYRSPGVILLRARVPIAVAIEELLLIWAASDSEEWINRLAWIPL